MGMIKLERNGKIIERTKADYEANKSRYDFRGFTIASDKPAKEKKVEPVAEQPKDQTIVEEDLNSESTEDTPKEEPKKKAK